MPALSARPQSFLSELKHGRVPRVAVGYAVVAWCVVQVPSLAVSALLLAESLPRTVLVLALLGFSILPSVQCSKETFAAPVIVRVSTTERGAPSHPPKPGLCRSRRTQGVDLDPLRQ